MHNQQNKVQAILISAGSWYLRQTGRSLQDQNALSGLYISDKNSTGINPALLHRCWPFHLAIIPFCLLSGRRVNRWDAMFWRMVPVWSAWLKRQQFPYCNVVQAIGPFATEAFDIAERLGALKVFDAANSHPVTQTRLMQAEFNRWIPGIPLPSVTKWYVNRASRDIIRADLILCPSSFVLESMLENGIPENKCLLLPFGADTSVFKPRTTPPKNPRFLTTGTLCLRKGHQYLFPAFEQLLKKAPHAELICVGDIRANFLPLFKKWKGSFLHIPYLNHEDLSSLMQTCTAFVLPSIEEGYARVIGEALASGLPVIATHESGATTTITDGEQGIIIPSASVNAIETAMVRLALDSNLAENMGRKAVQTASPLTWEAYGRQLCAAYRERLQDKGLLT